jgi:hypothetical protein
MTFMITLWRIAVLDLVTQQIERSHLVCLLEAYPVRKARIMMMLNYLAL